jgi:hypothetical protein
MKMRLSISICIGFLGANGVAFAEGSSCKDTIVIFNDDNPIAPTTAQAPRVTVVLDCMASSANLPEQTTLNYFTYSAGQFCQSNRVCGNVKAWRGQFKIGTRIYFGQPLYPQQSTYNMGNNNNCDDSNDNDNNSNNNVSNTYVYPGNWWGAPSYCDSGKNQVYAEFKISREIINRDCGPVEQWQCLVVPQPPGQITPPIVVPK